MAGLTVVVPCYNEAARLDAASLLAFIDGHADASLLLVDDGSTDATAAVLDRLAAERPGRIRALQLTPNRCQILRAMRRNPNQERSSSPVSLSLPRPIWITPISVG